MGVVSSLQIKYRGTTVTVESFREWRVRFDEERRRVKESSGKGKESSQATARLTGDCTSVALF